MAPNDRGARCDPRMLVARASLNPVPSPLESSPPGSGIEFLSVPLFPFSFKASSSAACLPWSSPPSSACWRPASGPFPYLSCRPCRPFCSSTRFLVCLLLGVGTPTTPRSITRQWHGSLGEASCSKRRPSGSSEQGYLETLVTGRKAIGCDGDADDAATTWRQIEPASRPASS